MTIVDSGRRPKFSESMEKLSKEKGSPCLKCMVVSTCRKSFIDKSACEKFAYFIQDKMIKAGIIVKDN